jgi:hypothetical protein
VTVQKRPPEGAVGRCPAGFALDSGQRDLRASVRNGLNANSLHQLPPHGFRCFQTSEITTDPSPTPEATRLTDPARTSPTA